MLGQECSYQQALLHDHSFQPKEPFVYLVDGKIRTLDHPKKKRIKHVQVDRHIPEWIQNVIREGRDLQDSDVIRGRREYGEK